MDFIPLMDAIGEAHTALLGGAVIGFAFGLVLQRTAFCTRTAVLQLRRRSNSAMPATWLIAFSAALFAVQALLASGSISVVDSRYFSGQSISGAAIGGALFGIGMMLARGCVSRMVVLGAGGNLRALYTLGVLTLFAFATLYGMLVPVRDLIASVMGSAAIGRNALIEHAVPGNWTGAAVGMALGLGGLMVALKARIGLGQVFGGLFVGLLIASGWYFTATLATQTFEPVAIDSLSYIRPFAQTAGFLGGMSALPTFDLGIVSGTFVGGLVAALTFGEFRVVHFGAAGAPSISRYTLGGALMGFGGVLAAGCTVGAGLTGGSVLAISALVAISAMVFAGAATDVLIDRAPTSSTNTALN